MAHVLGLTAVVLTFLFCVNSVYTDGQDITSCSILVGGGSTAALAAALTAANYLPGPSSFLFSCDTRNFSVFCAVSVNTSISS